MLIRSIAALAIAALVGASAAFAEDAAPPPQPTKAARTAVKVTPVSPEEAVAKANDYFNGATTMIADFVQVGADNKRFEGQLYVQKPGRMRFEYDPPAPVRVLADGTSVAVQDLKIHKQDIYFIGQTPLKFLLKDHIDLAQDTKILDVTSNSKTTSIAIEDSATFGGTSHITLIFDTASFQLRQWLVLDPQGYETTVTLFNVNYAKKPDPALFKIDDWPVNTHR